MHLARHVSTPWSYTRGTVDQAAAHLIGAIRSAVVKGISTTGSGRQVSQPTSCRDGESHASTQPMGREENQTPVRNDSGIGERCKQCR